MKIRLAAVALFCLSTAAAHRLDEYLQATTLSLEKDRVQAQLRLTPGVAVVPLVIALIDTDGDGNITASEQQAYARRVLSDLSVSLNGAPVALYLVQASFPTMDAFKEGLGEIRLDLDVPLPGDTVERKLTFDNHHQERVAAYLMNCLIPEDPKIRITGQTRNYSQSRYQLNYVQEGAMSWWWLAPLAGIPVARLLYLARPRTVCRDRTRSEPRP